jgi:TIR domain-containing protein
VRDRLDLLVPDVFISYSRLDREFVRTLHEALVGAGRSDWVDWRAIPPTAEWLGEIVRAIHASDAFVFVITPHSTASDVCRQELAEAARQHKRIVPVMRQPVDASALPDPLPRLNWIPFQESDDFDAAVGLLLTALDLDLDCCGKRKRRVRNTTSQSSRVISHHPVQGSLACVRAEGRNWWAEGIYFLNPRGCCT